MYRPKRENLVLCDFGKKGSGKSFLAKEIIEEFDRVIIIDSNGEYDFSDEGKQIAEVITGYRDSLLKLKEIGQDEDCKTHFCISLRTLSIQHDLMLLDVIGTIPNILVVVEETSRYVSADYIPDAIANLIRYGRHLDISQMYIARRPSEISRELTANADITIWFKTKEPRDLTYFKSNTGQNPSVLRTLKKYHCYVDYDEKEKLPVAVEERL